MMLHRSRDPQTNKQTNIHREVNIIKEKHVRQASNWALKKGKKPHPVEKEKKYRI